MVTSLAITLATAACGEAPGPGPGSGPLPLYVLSDAAEHALEPEEAAALEWAREQPGLAAEHLQLDELAGTRLRQGAVLWWHHAASPTLPSSAMGGSVRDAVQSHLERGSSLLLTLFAASWVVPLGVESSGPTDAARLDGSSWARWGADDSRILAGFQSYRGHPLLRRFWGATYTATPAPGRSYPSVSWSGDRWPARGRVVAVGRRFIGIESERRVLVEYPPDATRAGRIVAIGEGIYLSDPGNANRRHMELFLRDALGYVGGQSPPAPPGASIASTGAPTLPAEPPTGATGAPPGADSNAAVEEAPEPTELPSVLGATTYWTRRAGGVRLVDLPDEAPADRPLEPGVAEAIAAARSGLLLERQAEPSTPFNLYSPRVLAIGQESGSIEEIWSQPVRLLRSLRLGLSDPATGGPVTWLPEAADIRYTARPESRTFVYQLEDASVTVDLAVAREHAGVVALITVHGDRPWLVHAAWEPDNGIIWPRPEDDLGELLLGWDAGARAALWRDPSGDLTALAGFDVAPARVNLGGRILIPPPDAETSADGQTPSIVRTVELAAPVDPATDPMRAFVIGAAPLDGGNAREIFDRLRGDPASVWTSNANYYARFLAETLTVATPDSTFNEAFRWAKVGLDAFRVTTPGIGTGLAAGYAASHRAETSPWHRDNDFLRRPGYGWYFGRDAIWTALAADAYGGTDLSAEALRLLARYQDVDGKILHEMTPSWSLHYDAADSTPLFLLGLDHHVRTTGDRELLRALWPTVRRAMAFLDSTDSDGDGFIENTAVGHGWIEGGSLYGAHTTFYLAGLWVATLDAVARMATWMSDAELAASTEERRVEARAALERDFWDAAGRTYHYGKNADGSYKSARTVLPAVPMVFGLLDGARVRPLLDLFASSEITSDWGARLIERSSADYDPLGYHHGMVWPLYTGWTALAGYRYGRPLLGHLHANQNLRLVRQGNLGHLPEALHGEIYRSAGVTSHQAWSHALTILPVVEGLLGLDVDAVGQRLRILPRLPGGWDEVTAQPVRVGDGTFRVTVFQGVDASGFRIDRLAGGAGVQLDLALPFPRSVLVNLDRDATEGVAIPAGEIIVDTPTEKLARVEASLTADHAVVTFAHSRFPQVIQPIPAPDPESTSAALRVLDSRYAGGELWLRLEGIPGTTYGLSLATPWSVREVTGPVDRVVVAPGPGRALLELTLPGTVAGYQRAEVTVSFRN